MNKGTNRPRIGAFILGSILFVVLLLSIAVLLQKSFDTVDYTDEHYVDKTLWSNGVAYYPRQDISTLLVLGIDRSGPVKDSGSYNNDGLSDAVMLIIFDHTAMQYNVLSFNRDTMVTMPVLGVNGRQVGSTYAQLALAHTFGNGLHTSCENVVNTVSAMANYITIDYYLSMSMDAVGVLNDAVGGVRVTVSEDFSKADSSIPVGEVVLNGQQAINFIRMRQGIGDQLNISRMHRQEVYINGFIDAFHSRLAGNVSNAMSIYNEITPYVVTNCSDRILTKIFEYFNDYTFGEIISPDGENVMGEKYMEFHMDKQQFSGLVLQMLYAPK